MLLVVRWCLAVVLGLAWFFALLLGIADTLCKSGGEFTRSSFYHVSVLLGLLAVAIVPLGEFDERAPYAFLSVLPEIVSPIDVILSVIRDRR